MKIFTINMSLKVLKMSLLQIVPGFATYGCKKQQSLGKMFMSLVALVFGVSACYRTLKRGAVQGPRS